MNADKADSPVLTVVDAVAAALGYNPSIDGLIGSGLSRMIAYQRASDVVQALGIPPMTPIDKVRAWGTGAVTHLGPVNTDSPIPPVSVPLSPSAAPGVVPVPRNTRQDGDDTETETADEGFWRRLATGEDFDPFGLER